MIKKIDLENHFYDISSVEALQSRAKGDYPYWDKETNTIHWLEGIAMCQDKFYENLLDFANIRLKIMDELGIEKAVISLAPGIEALPPEESRIACKKANDALYKVCGISGTVSGISHLTDTGCRCRQWRTGTLM